MLVHLAYPPEADELASLQAQLDPAVSLTLGPARPTPAGYHVLVSGRAERADLTASPHLHTVIVPWAGIPLPLRQLLADFPHLALYNLHHNAAPVAELALALLLAAAKFIVPFDQSLRHHDWTPRYQPSPAGLLNGKTALILGYGAIGQRVARACAALGMQVLATRRQITQAGRDGVAEIHPPEALPHLLPQAHALIICLPQTPQTTGLLGAAELALLPAGAVLVNIGRGPIVDEAALYHALRAGHLRAAGLDVWYNYPAGVDDRSHTPASSFPFHELDNVVLSPHRGGATDETDRLRMTHLARLLNGLARGETVPGRVDLAAGY